DVYQNDVYERPTTSLYQMIDNRFAAAEYYGYVDITEARVGWDSQFLYVAIKMYGLDRSTSDGTNTRVGPAARYGFRFSKDAHGRNGYLFVVDQPERKGQPHTTFHQWGTSGFRDGDGDVGGRGLINNTPPSGRKVTKADNAQEGNGLNGYDQAFVT